MWNLCGHLMLPFQTRISGDSEHIGTNSHQWSDCGGDIGMQCHTLFMCWLHREFQTVEKPYLPCAYCMHDEFRHTYLFPRTACHILARPVPELCRLLSGYRLHFSLPAGGHHLQVSPPRTLVDGASQNPAHCWAGPGRSCSRPYEHDRWCTAERKTICFSKCKKPKNIKQKPYVTQMWFGCAVSYCRFRIKHLNIRYDQTLSIALSLGLWPMRFHSSPFCLPWFKHLHETTVWGRQENWAVVTSLCIQHPALFHYTFRPQGGTGNLEIHRYRRYNKQMFCVYRHEFTWGAIQICNALGLVAWNSIPRTLIHQFKPTQLCD